MQRFRVQIEELLDGLPSSIGEVTPLRYAYELEADSETDAVLEGIKQFELETGRKPSEGAAITAESTQL